jgi:hypothetical protein
VPIKISAGDPARTPSADDAIVGNAANALNTITRLKKHTIRRFSILRLPRRRPAPFGLAGLAGRGSRLEATAVPLPLFAVFSAVLPLDVFIRLIPFPFPQA